MTNTQSILTPTKGELTRQLLIESAYRCFLKQGYHGTSMREIAKTAGLALGGIYNHFGGKEEMFQAVMLTHHPFLKIFPKIITADQDQFNSAEEMLREATRLIFEEIRQEPQLLNLMFIELVELEGANLPDLFPKLQPAILTFLQRLNAYQPDWRIPSPILFVRSYIGLIIGIYITDRFVPKVLGPDLEQPITTQLDDTLEIYFHGLFKS